LLLFTRLQPIKINAKVELLELVLPSALNAIEPLGIIAHLGLDLSLAFIGFFEFNWRRKTARAFS